MRKIWFLFFVAVAFTTGAQQTPQQKLSALFTTTSRKVLVTAHRGDWRNAPENSVQGIKNCIGMGVDISEFDMKKTRDGHLVIMHDKTIDRSTNGKGRPEDYTLEELKKFRLLSGTGHPTSHPIPTFTEILAAAKNKIIVDIDKGYEYYDEVLKALQQQNMVEQTILNIYGLPFDSIQKAHGSIPDALTLQLIVNARDTGAPRIIDTYKSHKRTIIQITFALDTASILQGVPGVKKHFPIWFNSLWPEQCGGHDDDRAVEGKEPDATWGWLVARGASIIQTDRPFELLQYLRKNEFHQ